MKVYSGHEVLEIGQEITCKVFTRCSIPGFRRGRSCACESQFIEFIEVNLSKRKRGSSVVSALASGARGPRFYPRSRQGKFRSPNTLSLVSFAGMTLDKCIVLQIGTLTGCPLYRESHPLCRLKNPTVISIWLLVGFHPATLTA